MEVGWLSLMIRCIVVDLLVLFGLRKLVMVFGLMVNDMLLMVVLFLNFFVRFFVVIMFLMLWIVLYGCVFFRYIFYDLVFFL